MVHWVFSSFGKHPVVINDHTNTLGSPRRLVSGEAIHRMPESDGQHDTTIPESTRDDEFSSQRASAGSSTLSTKSTRAQTADCSHSVSHNLCGWGKVLQSTPANFYAGGALDAPRQSSSLYIGAGNEPRPSWPLLESTVSVRGTSNIVSAPATPTGPRSTSHRRSLSSSKSRLGHTRPRTSHELTRSSPERILRSHEYLRTPFRADTLSPLPDLDEHAGPPSAHMGVDDHLIRLRACENTLTAALPEDMGSEASPSHAASQRLVPQRTSSRRAPTITSEVNSLRNVDPAKVKRKPLLSPYDGFSRSPGSRGGESRVTALPRFLYTQSSLEEQLEAAVILQSGTSPLSASSLRSTLSSRLATELYTISYLIFFSICGTLARLGLQALTFYPGAPVATSVLWPNFAGTFVLGFLAEDRRLFCEEWGPHRPEAPSFNPKNRDIASSISEKFLFPDRRGSRDEDQASQVVSHDILKNTIPLFIGLTTGFCGSLTSFSSFMRDAFLAMSNDLPTPISHSYPTGAVIPNTTDTVHRAAGDSVMAVFAVVLITIWLSIGGLRMGAHLAILMDRCLPTFRFTTLRQLVDPSFVLLGWGIWIGAIVMCVIPPDRPGGPQSSETWRQALFACAFAPLGCLLRFYISTLLNAYSASFPLGTFAVNMFGTAVQGMAYDLQHVRTGQVVGGGRVPCQVLQGIQDGFCGSLTTISTWAAELNGLRRHHGYIYGLSSIICGLSLMVAIMGGVLWITGWSQPMCSA